VASHNTTVSIQLLYRPGWQRAGSSSSCTYSSEIQTKNLCHSAV